MLGALTVAAYSYMALVPIIQPPIIRALTTSAERRITMPYQEGRPVSRRTRVIFPILITLVAGLIAPSSVALVGALMFGNLVLFAGLTELLARLTPPPGGKADPKIY